jgi:hypothetical protein
MSRKKSKSPVDIVDRKPGQCAAIVRSEGLIHWACGKPVEHMNPDWHYCRDHWPGVPLEVSAEKYAKAIERRFVGKGG